MATESGVRATATAIITIELPIDVVIPEELVEAVEIYLYKLERDGYRGNPAYEQICGQVWLYVLGLGVESQFPSALYQAIKDIEFIDPGFETNAEEVLDHGN
jgi:hypothetical protein